MIGYDIYHCFTMEHFRFDSNYLDDQNLLLATVHKLKRQRKLLDALRKQ
jgi:hypothetical protein